MHHGTGQSERTDTDASPRRIPAEEIRPGDTVRYTSRVNATYHFEVADVGPEMITFATGQMVHLDRLDREPFTVIRNTTEEAAETVGDREAEDSEAPPPGRQAPLAE